MAKKIPVGVLGATGAVGQRFIQLLADHPWFEVAELVASDRSAGKSYREACTWRLATPLPDAVASMTVKGAEAKLSAPIQFSGLDSSVAGEVETRLASEGHAVISNSRNHRMAADVPLLVPEINADHLDAVAVQRRRTGRGYIVTNPNCSVVGLAMALAPLHRAFGVESAAVATLQALSGAGYPGVASLDAVDNVIPYIGGGEEEKIETEPRKVLGRFADGAFVPAEIALSASVHRVAVTDGHTMAVFLRLHQKCKAGDAKKVLAEFKGEPQDRELPFAPRAPIHVLEADDRPQPRLDRDRERGMAVSVGRVREDGLFHLKLEVLVHNTIRGAAGVAVLNAELIRERGLVP